MYRVAVRITQGNVCNVLCDLKATTVMVVLNKNRVPGQGCTEHEFDLMLSPQHCP